METTGAAYLWFGIIASAVAVTTLVMLFVQRRNTKCVADQLKQTTHDLEQQKIGEDRAFLTTITEKLKVIDANTVVVKAHTELTTQKFAAVESKITQIHEGITNLKEEIKYKLDRKEDK
jgi:septation ring formation regulator EzrA